MLISYQFNNFCSFNIDSEFSLEAPSGKVKNRFGDNYVSSDTGFDLLKTAVIVGENAGGKSNFIGSISFLKKLFDSNDSVKSIQSYINSNSLLSEENPVQRFELSILHGGSHIYTYKLAIDSNGIVAESLIRSNKKKNAKTIVFSVERAEGAYRFVEGKVAKELKTVLKNGNNSFGLFISKLALLGVEDAGNVVDWMLNTLYPGAIVTEQDSDVKKRESDITILKDSRYLDIFRMVDYSICGIEIDNDKPYSKTLVIRKDVNGQELKRELSQDSTGVREFFAWAVQIFRVVYENKVVFADEMDRVLNPILSDRVIAYINGMEHKGQFVFSTHNVLHLNLKTYMKEQIYFITKDRDNLTSELYALSDFPEVRYETTKIYEFYMKGILGGTAFE